MQRAVLFDIDGTLIDSVDLHAWAWHEAFVKFGHDVKLAQARGQIMPARLKTARSRGPRPISDHSPTARKTPHDRRNCPFRRAPTIYVTASVGSWLATIDHKRIAILFAVTITVFFFMGDAAITAVRHELFVPNGWLLTVFDSYNKLFSFHGIIMVWFFLVPSIPNTMEIFHCR